MNDGAAAPADPLAVLPEVWLGDKRATVHFSGLAPTFVGLWQINATIPTDAPTGPAVPLVVVHGVASNAIPLAIE